MTKTDEALFAQTVLLNQFAEIIRNLIRTISIGKADKEKSLSQVAALLATDEETAAKILANSPQVQLLIDDATDATLPQTPLPDSAIAS